ncbi:PTS sugar transporter subunit IIA [Jeotgalibaca sp. MA1X17-3]|nr:PTS sugar transporter subunit IIA [Jeotgalibaca sp. MA1X17-3]
MESSRAFFKALKRREKEVTTGFKDGIAIPHSKNKTVLKPTLMFIKFTNPIEWESMDDKPVHIAFALAIPEGKNQEHLKLLSTISRALIDDSFTEAILEATSEKEILELVQAKLANSEE